MQICVLNGSPKGETSVTMQYVRFLELANPDHTFVTHHISRKIVGIEKKPEEWEEICSAIRNADLILWATPVYFQHVPAQYKRFVELLFERNTRDLFTGKYAASLSTSVHFFDQKVHEYLQGISEDLGMNYAGSFSAAMNDLFEAKNQHQLVLFGRDILSACNEKRPELPAYPPLPAGSAVYTPGTISPVETHVKQVLILHDATPGSNLEAMVRQMACAFPDAKSLHLDETGMKGGCLGCCQCAFDNQCVYSDGFCSFWKEQIELADIIIYAGYVRDRYLSAAWKQFFDRSFFLGHVPRFENKQLVLMIEGPLVRVPGLRENLTSLLGGGNLVDIITDEPKNPGQIDALIRSAAERAVQAAIDGYDKPPMFPTVAGHIVLRDAVWGDLRPFFRADHRYYKKHGLYDFPQYQYRKRLSRFFLSLMMGLGPVQKKVKPMMSKHMVQSYARIFTESQVLKQAQRQ
ncbi:MAG TPA: NAD(P)H-dependent oxidoreductase [Methanospirillum sp.]|uniref:NAD(P)H-dependent oxidoreductase n=1 Tax=Methanospirillum sp. TaxID=45200 RepID=UPI002B83B55D|nr:NAD(P)H-dependent oxidoreductase [Methanospirillum sp.]HWQ63904.1 NAD(P)H-dependent oxidoreductase [Methanospirillum sp.]